jgi:hypothetical protein
MPNDESLSFRGASRARSISSEARQWARAFVKQLEIEFLHLASELPSAATWPDFERAMILALRAVFDEIEPSESVERSWEEIAGCLTPSDADACWTREKNVRRLSLIDKQIQRTISPQEAIELLWLTQQMRADCDREEMVPLKGARELHRRLLDMADSKGASS